MKLSIFFLAFFFAVSCSTHKNEKRKIEKEVSESNVSSPQALGTEINDLIENSKTLTQEQKEELRSILDANKKLAMELSEKSYKYRGVLVNELLSGKADAARVKILENDIEKVEKLRLKNTFDTVKKITRIVKGQPDNKEFAPHLIHPEGASQMLR